MLHGFILHNRNAHKSRPLDLILSHTNLNHTHSIYLKTILILSSHPHLDGLHFYVYASSSGAKDFFLICLAFVIKKFFLLHYIQVLCQSRLCKADHDHLTYLMLQRQLSHLNGRKLDHRQV
jgi:hypothetical protein